MLVVAKQGHEDQVTRILEKWELEAAVIGRVTDDGLFRVREDGDTVAEIPALPLTTGCPTYEREGIEALEIAELRDVELPEMDEPGRDLSEALLSLLGSPNIGSRRWIYNQYDTTVRTGTAVRPGGDAGVVRIRGTRRAVAATTDCNGRYVCPGSGARAAVAEAARNLVCTGALPLAITNNLNFGNPTKPHIYYQFRQAVEGMAEACRIFETPVTGGNVSFYNETDGQAIYPTPVIGMVGVVEDLDHITRHPFRRPGDDVVLLGVCTRELGGSEYLYHFHELVAGAPPSVDLLGERSLQQAVLAAIHGGLVTSAHDVSDGGLAVALAECAIGGETVLGVEVEMDDALPPVPLFFGEAQGRIVLSCDPARTAEVLELAGRHGVPAKRIGSVVDGDRGIRLRAGEYEIHTDSAEAALAYRSALPRRMDQTLTADSE
ncbi:MAG: AIR synthase-related protein [Gemmatimonadota bacterium]